MQREGLVTILFGWAESAQRFHTRNPFASGGVYEDPATGAATAAFAGYLRDIVIGLAAVIVGESLLPSRKLYLATIAVILGAIVYRFFIALALNSDFIGLQAQDLNLVTAVLVTIALVVPRLRAHWSGKKGA